ncbi:TadE family protein [Georgenia daeguensis]|uniref:Pilus assembly protein n=1 Tax=Georgenia daeguensis TaxID=908355 RepID=A0ABP8EV52_9MICO
MVEGDRGSAVVEFVLVSVLVLAIVVALLQLVLGLHVRNTLVDSASEGARHAALVGSTPAEGVARTRELIGLSLSPRYAREVSASLVDRGGTTLVRVRVSAPLPVLGLLGPSGVLDVSGHAVLEEPLG